MNIDIKPTRIVQGSDVDGLVMGIYEFDALYHFRYANEESATVMFNPDDLKAFQPNRTVSEMMERWEEGLIGNIELYKTSIKNKRHPYWTFERLPKATQLLTKIEIEVGYEKFIYPSPLTKSQREHYQSVIDKCEARSGKMIFEKIV